MISESHLKRIIEFEERLHSDSSVIGFSIDRSDDGFEPCYVFSDLTTVFLPVIPNAMSSAWAIKLGRNLARLHNKPFRSSLSAFKSLIQEDSSNA